MKKFISLLLFSTLLIGLLAVIGCGEEEAGNVETSSGSIKYTVKGDKVQVTSEGKTTTYTVQEVSEKALGVPIPGNAKVEEGSIAALTGSKSGAVWEGAAFWTPDEVTKVIDWYKNELKGTSGLKDTSTVLDGQPVGLFEVQGGGSTKSIVVSAASSSKGKTQIQIATISGAK